MTLRDASTFTFNAHHLQNIWHSILKATKITIRLNFVFSTFGPIAMFKEQALSFHVVYKTLHKITSLTFPATSFTFLDYITLISHFNPRDNWGKLNLEKQ